MSNAQRTNVSVNQKLYDGMGNLLGGIFVFALMYANVVLLQWWLHLTFEQACVVTGLYALARIEWKNA